MSHESSVNLLVASRSLNDTEMYVNALRNAGLAVHATRVEDDEELSEALNGQTCDLLLCACDEDGIDLGRIIASTQAAGKDIPLIIVSDHLEPDRLLQAMREGACDGVPKSDLGHLQLVAVREVSALRTRRELAGARKQLTEAEDQRNGLIESSRDAIAYVHEGMHVMTNPAYLEMFGFAEQDELEGMPIMDMVVPEQQKEFKTFLRSLGKGDSANSQLELTCQKSDESTFSALLEFTRARFDGEPCTQIVIRSQANSKELEQKLHLLSSKDTQTGLFNRQYFLEHLDEHLKGLGDDDKSALLYITLDNFQELRDSVGLAASDTAIRQVAELLREKAGQDALLARFGDLTFTLLSHDAEASSENGLAETFCRMVHENEFSSDGKLLGITCSIGVAPCEQGSVSSQALIDRAYTACNTAQEDGGNTAVIHQASAAPAAAGAVEKTGEEAAETSKLIKAALENERFRLVYQPIVSLQGDSRENYAVLLRMLDENDEETLPKDFLDQAEHDGLMGEVDRWVLKTASRELELQRKEGRKTVFFVNLSADSVRDESFLLFVCDCLRDFNAKGSWLCFQIKEEDIRQNLAQAKALLEGLKKIKCQLAIDRFGVSPKPEALLKHLDFDYAKLDASFMKDLASDQASQDKLNAIHELIRSHEVKSVATAVEDANSLAILWTVGLNYIQGYFLQEPSENIAYNFQKG